MALVTDDVRKADVHVLSWSARRALLLLVLVAVAACTSGGRSTGRSSAARPSSPLASPASAQRQLGPAPADCPSSGPLLQRVPPWGLLLGGSPVWGSFYLQPQRSTDVMRSPRPHLGPRGWGVKVLWLVEPSARQTATVAGRTAIGDQTVWFGPANAREGSTLRLDPAQPGTSTRRQGWIAFPSNVYFPRAGCYTFTATWPGGSWSVTFGYGR